MCLQSTAAGRAVAIAVASAVNETNHPSANRAKNISVLRRPADKRTAAAAAAVATKRKHKTSVHV